MADGHKDYSATPLWRKLGIREGSRVRLVNAPDGFDDALVAIAPLPHAVDFLRRSAKDIDVVVLFTTERRVLERPVRRAGGARWSPTAGSGSPGRRRPRRWRPT